MKWIHFPALIFETDLVSSPPTLVITLLPILPLLYFIVLHASFLQLLQDGFFPQKRTFWQRHSSKVDGDVKGSMGNGNVLPCTSLYTMYTRFTCKGLDNCPLPVDVRDSCFLGGAGA